MNAIIYVFHGSRVNKTKEEAVFFIKQVMNKIDVSIQEFAFLELAQPTIETAFKRCVQRGATSIIVIPVLLLNAAHAKKDIPILIQQISRAYPTVKIKLGQPIGVHEKIIDILLERISEKEVQIGDNSMLVLAGRGSSDPDVKRDLSTIGNMLASRSNFRCVEICFLAAAEPNIRNVLLLAKQSSYEQVIVIPYLLFTGFVMSQIKTLMKETSREGPEMILCSYLGYHPIIGEIITENAKRLLEEVY